MQPLMHNAECQKAELGSVQSHLKLCLRSCQCLLARSGVFLHARALSITFSRRLSAPESA
eukprot:9676340-Alexandrium_andersonii.AAC.1